MKAWSASPTQAILAYAAPDSLPCTVEVSEASGYTPLVNDVNPALFANSNLDTRATSVMSGKQRIVVVGTRLIQTGLDLNNYSRALQQNTLHYYRVTCSGPSVATGTFSTVTLPAGSTYSDLIPLDANGNYLFPTVRGVRNEALIDPQTGVLLTLVNTPGDNAPHTTPAPTAGGFGESCNSLLDAQGNYHCLFNDAMGGVYPNLYAINPRTGASTFLGSAFFYRTEIDPMGASLLGVAGGGERVMWDPADANTAYVAVSMQATGRVTVAKWTYTAPDSPVNVAGQQAPHVVVDMLSGQDLTALAHSFNPTLDTRKFTCQVVGMQSHYFLLKCARGYQDTYAWEGAYDLGNGLPLGQGGNGHMAALAPAWQRPGSRWCGDHSYEFVGNVPVYSFSVHSLTGTSQAPFDGGGPYHVSLAAPMPSANKGDLTAVTVTSAWDTANWGPADAQWAPGEPVSVNPDHFLQTIQPGDMLMIEGEYVRLRTKTSSTAWIVERGVLGTPAAAHSGASPFLAACDAANSLMTYSGGYLWWDFVDSPDGTNGADWVMNFGNHPVSRGGYRVDSGYPIRAGAVTDKSTWGMAPSVVVTSHPFFGGKSAPADGNSYQKHASMASGNTSSFFDQTYFVGTTLFAAADQSAVNRLTGNLYQYHYETGVAFGNGTPMARKHFATLTKTAGRAFVDISGPGATLTGDPADSFKYCIANKAGECAAGSTPGSIYFNHPQLDPETPWCTGGENPVPANDVCIGNFASNGLAAMQFMMPVDRAGNLLSDTTGALTYRPLTRLFQTYENNLGSNLKLTWGGEIALMLQKTDIRQALAPTNIWAIHVPPTPVSDGIDRSTFVPATLNLTAPAGMRVYSARVKFWYTEQSGSSAAPFCTSRREACVATAATIDQANPFSYSSTDSYSPMSCAYSCTITVPVYPLHTAYLKVEFLNMAGAVVATKQGVAMENTIFWAN